MTYVPYARRSFSGSAPDTTLTGNVDNSTLTVAITDGTGWPDGSGGNFVVIFEPGTTSEEKALASSRSGNTLTLAQRALEGSAVSHTASSVIRHGLSALDVNEANYAVSQTVALVAAKGDVLYGTAANTLGKLAKGSANQSPMWDSSGALVAGNPTPGAHTHAETDVTSLVSDLGALQSQQATNTSAIAANTSAITALQGNTGGPLAWCDSAGGFALTTTAATTPTAFNATTLSLSFTAPASGKVLLRTACMVYLGGSSSTWTVMYITHGTTTQVGRSLAQYTTSSATSLVNDQVLTGLTPGTVYHLDLAARAVGGSDALNIGTNGSFVTGVSMSVWAAS